MSRVNTALYRLVGAILHRLPSVRGKVRLGLSLYKSLGLETHHIVVEAMLRRPVGHRMRLDLHSLSERMAYLDSGYDYEAVTFLARCLSQRGGFLDIGANIGLICIPLAVMLRASDIDHPASIYAIEAVRSNCQSLAHNIQLNGLDATVRVLCTGVGDRCRDVEIQVEGNLSDGQGTGTANILADGSNYACERIPLHITTVDNLIERGDLPADCRLIKIDVDGYDLKVLQGAAGLMARSRPLIYGEFLRHCLNWHGQSPGQVNEFALDHGYRTWVRTEPHWKFVPFERCRRVDKDLLLVPPEREVDLSWCLLA